MTVFEKCWSCGAVHERGRCEEHRRERARTRIWASLAMGACVLLECLVLVLAASLLYARLTYGDWTCGLPGVQCRKVLP